MSFNCCRGFDTMNYGKLRSLLLVHSAFASILCNFGFATEDAKRKEVLILYGLQSHMPVVQDWDQGIRQSIEEHIDGPVRVESEFLDLLRVRDIAYRDQWLALLASKYQGSAPDVLITVFDPALNFLLDNRDKLFPTVPVVFCCYSQ